MRRKNKQEGFSLIELMIVVGIMGILATLALPRFKAFQAKAKMTEAKTTLASIHTLQEAYFVDTNVYEAFAAYGGDAANCAAVPGGAQNIGFALTDCQNSYYAYSSVVGAPATTFDASAVSGAAAANKVCPGNGAHTFTLDETKTFTAEPRVGVACPN